jgi:hypothetical protein
MAAPKEERTVDIIVNGQKANASLKELDAAVSVLNNQFRKMAADDPGRAKLLADLQAAKARVADVRAEITGVTETTGMMKQAFASAFGFLIGGGIEGAIGKIFELGKSIFDTTAKFQTYESVMTNALGDKSKAQKALADIQQMAAKTPFSVDELTGSFIKFVNRGLQPSMAEMTKMADIAASQGKSFDQLTEAVLDAGGGEFERLKEFGIKASKSGDQVSLSFKGVNQTVKNTPEAINGAIMAFGSMKGIAGSTAAISATLEGQLSNLGDTTDQLKIKVGEGLKPAFTLILTLFGRFLDWIGRFVEAAAPLKSVFAEFATLVQDFYREIGDVLESLGLFSSKTDTVKMAVEALKFVLTLLLIPLKVTYGAAKGIVDVFIDWYNKSELLRGVLGGLGYTVISLFTTIKDNALKILGGVGDILVGIFSLDRNKIVAGFKSALAATADTMLEGGNKAAEAFKKGFEANKNNHITRTVRVKTETTEETTQSGVELKSDKSAADDAAAKKAEAAAKKAAAAAKKLQDKADQARLEALKEWVKMEEALEDARIQTITDKRDREIAQINLDATRKARLVTGTEQQMTEQLVGIAAERDRKLQELAAKYQKEADEHNKEYFEKQMAEEQAAEVEREARLQERFEAGLESERVYQMNLYDAKRASLEAQLLLEEAYAGRTSKLYTKTAGDLLRLEKDHNKQKTDDAKKAQKAKADLAKMELSVAGDVLSTTLDLLFQDEAARRKHHGLYVALAAAKIIIDGTKEVQAIWQYSAEQPENSLTAGVFGTVLAGIQTGLAVARTAVALGKIGGGGSGGNDGGGSYWAGGRTGDGSGLAVSPMGQLLAMSGMSIGTNGKLDDGSGFAVAGVVHEDEYVVPKWMRADPQVAAVEQWLEARRLRGFADGGATSSGSSGAALPVAAASPSTDGEKSYAVQTQMLAALLTMGEQLADVKAWQKNLQVNLDLRGAQNATDEYKKVQYNSAIRRKG